MNETQTPHSGNVEQSLRTSGRVPRRWSGLALAGVLVLLAAGLIKWSTGTSPEELAAFGYPGIFLMMIASGGALVVPMPGPAAVIAAGVVWDPLQVGLVAGLGNATGESLCFLTWRAAVSALEGIRRTRMVLLFEKWFRRFGFLCILVVALVPNPMLHVVGFVAAVSGYPLRRFWLACALGNCGKYIAMAFFGRSIGSLFGFP